MAERRGPDGGGDFTTVAKALAICLVVFTHADWAEADRLCPVFPFVVNSAVPLFMMVTGINYARSYLRKGASGLEAMCDVATIRRRARALLFPFIPIFLLEIPLAALRNHLGLSSVDLSPAGLLAGFASGGWGPGGYYLPVMIQVIFVYPLLCYAVRRHGWGAFGAVSFGSLVSDLLLTAVGFPSGVWRLLCVRYLPYLAFGALLATEPAGLRGGPAAGVSAAFLALGGGYLACLTYGPLAEMLAFPSFGWAGTSLPSALFFMGAFGLLYTRIGEFRLSGTGWRLPRLVASSTWFIFLFQSLWYFAGANSVFGFLPVPVAAVLFVLICVAAGCGFSLLWGSVLREVGKVRLRG